LFQFIKKNGPLPEKTAKIYFKQILLAVEYLHKESIIHRDLKLENVVLLPRKPYHLVKITDFGLAKLLGMVVKLFFFFWFVLFVSFSEALFVF